MPAFDNHSTASYGYHGAVKSHCTKIRIACTLLLAGWLGGCAMMGAKDQVTPAKSGGPPERSRWFIPFAPEKVELTETLSGRVIVVDGDTLDVDGTRVHLLGIDAPESQQLCRRQSGLPYRCGEEVAALLEQRVQRDRVECEIGRLEDDTVLGVCRHFGTNLNAWMVQQGYAVADTAESAYVNEEADAAANRRGLWIGIFERPSDWRERTGR